jgi:integrase
MNIETWGEALAYTIDTRQSWRTGNGRQTALINAGHFTKAVGVSLPIGEIDQCLINRVSRQFEGEGKSDATINRIVSAVSTVLNHCAFDGLIPTPPRFRRRKESQGRITFYTKDEVDNLYTSSINPFHSDDLADIVLVAAYTGMRQNELLQLKARDVDINLNTIFVGGRPDNTTKNGDWRSVPIHNHIANVIDKRLSNKEPQHPLFSADWLNKDQLLNNFKKVNRYIGKSDEYVFHTLRHSFGTWCAEAGVPVRTIMDLMGHKRIETTLRYAKATDKARSEAVNSI